MCLGIPGKVIQINGLKAIVEILGVQREITIALLEDVKINDYVIVHAGAGISKIHEEEALKTIEIFKEIGEINE